MSTHGFLKVLDLGEMMKLFHLWRGKYHGTREGKAPKKTEATYIHSTGKKKRKNTLKFEN